jgi:cytochrome c553
MKKLSLAFFLALAAAPLAAPAAPTGNAEAGKAKSTTCAACHGEDGNSKTGEFPRLAGQHADYLYNALTHYRAGKRKNPIMAGFAATLKPQDMADLAAYFSSQKGLEVKY